MNLQQIDPSDLNPNQFNTNVVAPAEMEKLTASLERYGWVRPVLARRTDDGLEILGGQHRVEAARELGHDTVPVIILEDISDTRAREIGLIDNARYGQDDAIGLAELLEEVGGAQMMSEFLPIGEDDLASLTTDIDDDEIENLLSDDEPVDTSERQKPVKTHQIMRFKVPISDADKVQDFFERIMDFQDFTDGDSLTNAGDALVYAVSSLELKEDQND